MANPICQDCRYWVAHNRAGPVAVRGECTRPLTAPQWGPKFRVVPAGGLADVSDAMVVMHTPFDWSCPAWEAQPAATDDAQCGPG